MRNLNRVLGVFAVIVLSIGLVACGEASVEDNRQADVDTRWEVFDRAKTKYPVPAAELQNFPMRGALVKFTLRQDAVNHPWFIYLYSMTGEPIGYYVGQTYPQSACNFLSSSEYLNGEGAEKTAPDNVMTAPSLDGMYYSGSGSNAACATMFFFDASTDAMITFSAQLWTATDVPVSGFEGPALGQTTTDEVTPADIPAP
jgi:hypothetical protein